MALSTAAPRRLLIIVNNFPPDRGGGAAVYGDLCFGLARLGYDVTVRCAYPYYPEWRDKSGRNGLRIWRYDEQGVHVERYGLYIPRRPTSILPRLVHEASLVLSLARALPRSRRYDAAMVISTALSTVAVAASIRMLFGVPLWLNVQDIAVDAASESGLLRAGAFVRTMRALQRWLFNRADVWSSISPVMCARLRPQQRRGQPMLLVPNWMDDALGAEIRLLSGRSAGPKPQRPVRLLYGGNIGMKQNLLALLRALHASDAAFEVTVHGDGAQAAAVRDWIDATGDPRFRFGPFLDAAGFAAALTRADYFLITESPDAGASFMPSKLIAGISAGVPILTVCDAASPLGSEVRASEPGPWFSWDQLSVVVDFLRGDAFDAQRHTAWTANALRRAGDFERDQLIARIGAALECLIERRPLPADLLCEGGH